MVCVGENGETLCGHERVRVTMPIRTARRLPLNWFQRNGRMRQIAVYTALEGAETMRNLSIMIKPASSLCNMRCGYCFYADVAHQRDIASYGLISDDTLETMLRAIFADLKRGDHLNLAFQGGEPTLAGLNFFRSVIRKVSALNQGVHVHYALQTNGLLLDDEWCAFLHENRFLVGLSYDLLPNRNDEARVDVHGQGTTKRVLETAKRLDRHQVEYNILCTLTEYVARNPHKVWNAIRQHPFRYVQFTPCLDDLEKKSSPYALKPASFASFYTQLFDDWFQEYRQGNYWSIKLFDDLIHRIAYGSVNACGLDGHCQPQLVVEADGSVYPCDFYCLDEYRMGSFEDQTLEELYDRSARSPSKAQRIDAPCRSCPYVLLCGGGCKRMRETVCFAADDAQCGMRKFLDWTLPRIMQIANHLKRGLH